MHRKARLRLLVLLPAAAIAAVLLTQKPPDPTYAGRSLGTWVARFTAPHSQDYPESRKAITTIVTNCLPSLIQQLKYDPRPRLVRMTAIAKLLPKSILTSNPNLANFISHDAKDTQAHLVCAALIIAGREARAAIPDLRQIAINTNCPASTRAIQALLAIDDDPAPTLAAIILNPNHPARHHPLTLGSYSQITTQELIQLLVPAVTNSNEQVACSAIDAIGYFARRYDHSIDTFVQGTELLVPTLQQAARDPREQVS